MLPFRVRVDLGVMAMNGFSAFPKALLEPYNQIVKCHIQDTRWEGLTPLQRSSRCILQPQLTGLDKGVNTFPMSISSKVNIIA